MISDESYVDLQSIVFFPQHSIPLNREMEIFFSFLCEIVRFFFACFSFRFKIEKNQIDLRLNTIVDDVHNQRTTHLCRKDTKNNFEPQEKKKTAKKHFKCHFVKSVEHQLREHFVVKNHFLI